jgi:hypothetical protein
MTMAMSCSSGPEETPPVRFAAFNMSPVLPYRALLETDLARISEFDQKQSNTFCPGPPLVRTLFMAGTMTSPQMAAKKYRNHQRRHCNFDFHSSYLQTEASIILWRRVVTVEPPYLCTTRNLSEAKRPTGRIATN